METVNKLRNTKAFKDHVGDSTKVGQWASEHGFGLD